MPQSSPLSRHQILIQIVALFSSRLSRYRFRRFVRTMLFRTIHDITLMLDRERAGREASPTAGVMDSQTVKAPAPGARRGYDA